MIKKLFPSWKIGWMITVNKMTGCKLGEKYDFVYQLFIYYSNFGKQFVFCIFCVLIKKRQNFTAYPIKGICGIWDSTFGEISFPC